MEAIRTVANRGKQLEDAARIICTPLIEDLCLPFVTRIPNLGNCWIPLPFPQPTNVEALHSSTGEDDSFPRSISIHPRDCNGLSDVDLSTNNPCLCHKDYTTAVQVTL